MDHRASERGNASPSPPRGAASPARLRLFVACEFPASWYEALSLTQERLRSRSGTCAQEWRWVRPEGFHLTLAFLGDMPIDREARIGDALRVAAAQCAPFMLVLGSLGTFGGKRPRVIWAGIDGELPALAHLQRQVIHALGIAGPNADRFSPHLTLARRRKERRAGGFQCDRSAEDPFALPAELHIARPPAYRVNAVSLMRSEPLGGGAVYTCRLRTNLRKN